MSTSKYKYLDDSILNNTHVWFKTLDANDNVIKDWPDQNCFSLLTYYTIVPEVKKILVYHSKKLMPYKPTEIERWINDINTLGFPCTFGGCSTDHYEFKIELSSYKYKAHLISTLMLIRALYEYGIYKVPEIYFGVLDVNPNADKFQELQNAHKSRDKLGYHNNNHMITHQGNGDNIEYKDLMKRYEECSFGIYDKHKADGSSYYGFNNIGQSAKWRG